MGQAGSTGPSLTRRMVVVVVVVVDLKWAGGVNEILPNILTVKFMKQLSTARRQFIWKYARYKADDKTTYHLRPRQSDQNLRMSTLELEFRDQDQDKYQITGDGEGNLHHNKNMYRYTRNPWIG